jgi:hypothetical protein
MESIGRDNHGRFAIGFKHTKSSLKKMSKTRTGKKHWWGEKISIAKIGHEVKDETKEKIRKSALKRCTNPDYIKKLSKSHTGYKMPIEQRLNIGKALIGKNIGKNGSNWKGGITPENRKIRNSIEIKLWRKSVFERDNYTCQKTGIRGGKLVAHHIRNFAECLELRTSISNGITLSNKSHISFHKKYGMKNNNIKQINKFLS